MLKLIALISKGILRDSQARRKFMFWDMLAALAMLFCGSVFISDRWAKEHPLSFMAYWLVCAWLTLTAVLLALFDIMIVRAAHRAARRKLENELLKPNVTDEESK